MGSRKPRRQKKEKKEEEMEHDLEAMEKLLNEDNSSDDNDNDVDEKDDGSTASESLPSGQEDSDSNEQDEDSGDEEEQQEEEEMEVESLKSSDDEEDEEGHPVEDESMDGDDENEDGDEEEEEELTSEDDDDDEEPQDSISSPLENNTNLQDEKCSFDIRNLTVIDPHQVNTNSLYKSTKKKKSTSNDDDEIYTISTPGIDKVNEEYLLEKASEGCTQLLEELWNLDMENAIATLPSYCTTTIPRSLPPPKPKEPTRWEKFAQERGIQSKSKKSRKVWDELTQSWKHLTGYNASSADPQSWPIMEVKRNDDPYEDPWQRVRDEKKDKVDKQSAARMRNQERAGLIDKGTATRTVKAKKAARDAGREGGAKDVDWKTTHANKNNKSTPVGIPKDLQPGQQRGKEMTNLALLATQRSTASMGKFDQMREGEPERNKATGIKKRKYESGTGSSSVKNEMKKSLKVLDNVLTGGGKEKERAIRRGEYSKGTTGYDYEYDDDSHRGFKKKKGRAGAGKMRKMTKKRAK